MKKMNAQQMCIMGAGKTISSCFKLKQPAMFTQLSNPIFQKAQRAKAKNIQYPVCYYAISNISRDTNFPMKGETKRPMIGRTDDSGQTRFKFGIVRAVFRIRLVYITNSEQDLYDFIGRWFFAKSGMGQRLNFNLEFYGAALTVLFHAQDELAVPTVEFDEERPMHYEFEGELELHGYISNVTDARDFTEVPILQTQQHEHPIITSHIGEHTTVERVGDSPLTFNFYMGGEDDYKD